MSDCLHEIDLRSVIEKSIASELLANAFAHLAVCAECRERLAALELKLQKVSAKTLVGEGSGSSGFDTTMADTRLQRQTGSTNADEKTLVCETPTAQVFPTKSIADFERQLTLSGLMSTEEISACVSGLSETERPGDAQALAEALIRQEKLTPYQAQVLAEGKTRGLVFGNYVVQEKLGEGGMGQVFLALHRRMKRLVALKILPPNLTRSTDALQRFHREVEVAAKLTHPNIAAAYDADEADGIHFLVMEHVDGPNLSAYVRQAGSVPVGVAVNLTLQAARGLSYAHTHGVIHRDIKPSNLLVNQEGMLKVLDMGLARLTDAELTRDQVELTQSGRVMGTVDYMAPEQALDAKNVDHRADIYSLGCTLYFLLTGKTMSPEGTLTQKLIWHQNETAPQLRAARPDVPESLELVFQQMLAKTPAARQASMVEVCQQLDDVLSELPSQDLQLSLIGIDLHICAPITDRGSHRGGSQTRVESPTKTYAPGEVTLPPAPVKLDTPAPKTNKSVWAWGGLAVVALLVVALIASFGNPKNGNRGGGMAARNNTTSGSPPVLVPPAPRPPDDLPVKNPPTPNPQPPTPPAPRPHEKLFDWIFQNGGQATLVLDDGQQLEVRSAAEVPQKPFELYAITLDNTGVRAEELSQLATAGNALQSLSLVNVKIGDKGWEHVGQLAQLQRLNLSHASITNDELLKLARLSNLRELNLQGTAITDQGISTLAGLTRLEKLFLADTQVGDISVKKLAELPALQEVGLNGSYLTDDGYNALASARANLKIHWDGKDLERSAAQKLLAKKVILTIVTRTGSESKTVTDKVNLPRERFWVTAVDVRGNPQIGDDDLKLLSELAKVQSLQLAGTNVTAAGLMNLYGLASLKLLDLGALPIPKTVVDALQSVLKECEIKQKPPADLVAAELVIGKQGAVTVSTPDGETLTRITAISSLPKGFFALRGVHLEGCEEFLDRDVVALQGLAALEQLEFSKTKISDTGLSSLESLPSLRFLSLSETKVTSSGLAQLHRFPALQRLYLVDTPIDSDGIKLIGKLAGLTHLSLAGTKLVEADLSQLKRLTKLQRLVLSNLPLTDASLELLRSCTNLKELLVDGTQITDAGAEELSAALVGCNVIANPPDPGRTFARWVLQQGGVVSLETSELKTVELKKVSQLPRTTCQVKAVDLADLPQVKGEMLAEKIRAATTLQELNLSGTSLNNAHMSGIAASTSLKRLLLSGVPISDAGLTNLAQMSQLELLDLRGTRITGAAFKDLAGLTSLTQLYVGSTQLSDRHLPALAACKQLIALDLSANKLVTDKGLAELKSLTQLQQLGLRSTGITDGGMSTVAEFVKLQLLDLEGTTVSDVGIAQLKNLKQLRSINLNKSQVTDGALSTLSGLTELRYLNVSRTKVTEGAVESLKQSLPQCRVIKSASTGPLDPEGTSGASSSPFGGLGL